jgi:hypothetical protein
MPQLVTVVRDTVTFEHTKKWKIVGCICLTGWLLGLVYATDAGLNFLDVIDFYINFTMLFVGFLETFAAGWGYGIHEMTVSLGYGAVLSYMFANFGSVLIACGIWFGVSKENGGVWGGFVALILVYLASCGVTCFFLKKKMDENPDKWTWSSIIWAITFKVRRGSKPEWLILF